MSSIQDQRFVLPHHHEGAVARLRFFTVFLAFLLLPLLPVSFLASLIPCYLAAQAMPMEQNNPPQKNPMICIMSHARSIGILRVISVLPVLSIDRMELFVLFSLQTSILKSVDRSALRHHELLKATTVLYLAKMRLQRRRYQILNF